MGSYHILPHIHDISSTTGTDLMMAVFSSPSLSDWAVLAKKFSFLGALHPVPKITAILESRRSCFSWPILAHPWAGIEGHCQIVHPKLRLLVSVRNHHITIVSPLSCTLECAKEMASKNQTAHPAGKEVLLPELAAYRIVVLTPQWGYIYKS